MRIIVLLYDTERGVERGAGMHSTLIVLWIFFLKNASCEEVTSEADAAPQTLTMCYFLERNTSGTIYDYNKAAAALDLAMFHANDDILPPTFKLTSVYREVGKTVGSTHVVATALELRDDGVNCDVYIGPGSGTTLEVLYNLINAWNVPMIGCPAGAVGTSAPVGSYNIVSRTSVTFLSIALVLLRFFDHFNYTSPAIFLDQSVDFYQKLGVILQIAVPARNQDLEYGARFFPFRSAVDWADVTKQDMIKANQTARVFVVSSTAAVVRSFMISARGLGMTNGHYIFIAVELFPSDVWGPFTWRANDPYDSVAREAYRSLALINLKTVTTINSEVFWQYVIKVSRDKYNITFTEKEQSRTDPVSTHFYDSVLLYANIVKEMADRGLDFRDGVQFTAMVANYSFQSPLGGTVTFDKYSDRLLDFEMKFFDQTGTYGPVLSFPKETEDVQFYSPLIFMGQTEPPPNSPFCGFRDENPACLIVYTISKGNKAEIAIGLVVFFTALGFAVYFAAQKIMQSRIDPYFWRITEDNLLVNHSPEAALSTISSKLNGDLESDSEADLGLVVRSCKSGTTGFYGNMLVSLLELPDPKLRAPGSIYRDALRIRRMHHTNLQKFLGVSVNDSNVCDYIVGEICQKGSLHDLIEDPRTHLDWEFKNSLIKDLTAGMVYIHSSPIHSHGCLNDAVCQIDGRFILKVGDYGLGCLHHKEDLEPYHISQAEFRNTRLLLWRAPELLRKGSPPGGTQKGDVYSYAILLQQIILRSEPFERGYNHQTGKKISVLNSADIVHEVCHGFSPPLRPPIPMSSCSHSLLELVDNCWSENPLQRPTFVRVRNIIQATFIKSGDNIVDHLIHRLEDYAGDLENQVQTETKAFMAERQRSAGILCELLPKSIAVALAQGQKVLPETYPSTTVYFGSVLGFKESLSRAKSALDTVTKMNNLYTTCDGVIAQLDVFKVEAVVDNYMIVSGLPVKNGVKHAENIADMALQLRQEIAALGEATGETFRLRVGINSGPCVASVVGLKMPRYCLFGDTVNTASRMESHGEAGKIHVSPTSYELLDKQNEFVLVERGLTLIKGKGEMTTYWLVLRNELAATIDHEQEVDRH